MEAKEILKEEVAKEFAEKVWEVLGKLGDELEEKWIDEVVDVLEVDVEEEDAIWKFMNECFQKGLAKANLQRIG